MESETDFWVFGYGSLIWNPGFEYSGAQIARAYGLHRSFCVRSVHYRGTKENPGLVLGLDKGGSCAGLAFQIANDKAAAVRDYLVAREQVTMIYREEMIRLRLLDGREVSALAFPVDRNHDQYAGRLAPEEAARTILCSKGVGGPNIDYLNATIAGLQWMGIRDHGLEAVQRAAQDWANRISNSRN